MSFDVNPLNNNPAPLKASKTQDGGAGNTGYFEQQKKKKEEEEFNKSLFKKKEDTFSLSDARDVAYVEPTFLMKLVGVLKMIFRSLFHK